MEESVKDYLIWAVEKGVPLKEMCDWLELDSKTIGFAIRALRKEGKIKPKYYNGKFYCTTCGKYKETDEFYMSCKKTKANPLGLNNRCIECERERTRARGKREESKEKTKREIFGDTKICAECGQEKDIDEFNWAKKSEQRLRNVCSSCRREKEEKSTIEKLKRRGY